MTLKERLELSKTRLHPGAIIEDADCQKILALLRAAQDAVSEIKDRTNPVRDDLLNAIAVMEAE